MAHIQKNTRAATGHLFDHYGRNAEEEKYKYLYRQNDSIDPKRTHLNYNLAPSDGKTQLPGRDGVLLFRLVRETCPGGGDGNFVKARESGVHGGAVHADHFVALAAVCLLNSGLHVIDGLVHREDAAEFEERGLKDAVGPIPQSDGPGGGIGVNGIELCFPL